MIQYAAEAAADHGDSGEAAELSPALVRYARRWAHARGWGDADDLLSAALWGAHLSTVTKPHDGIVAAPFRWAASFIYKQLRMVRHAHYLRRERGLAGGGELIEPLVPDRRFPRPEEPAEAAEFWDVAVAGLTAKQREAVLLVFRDDLGVMEAARRVANGWHRSITGRIEYAAPRLRQNVGAYIGAKPR
jgi:DNA-directed RNA polymerase specialized sigma24 family protein